jgi:3-oxoacyl-[acyl-carrier-protein] synthase II
VDVPGRLWGRLSRTQQLACVAADEALKQAQLPRRLGEEMRGRSGLFLATTVCGMDVNERFYEQYRRDKNAADWELMRRIPPGELGVLISRRHNIGARGVRNVCLSTCVGSAVAIGTAMDAINLGECDVAMAGGSEALCRVVLSGFSSLKVVAADGCRPFDRNRPGITVGEGAGILIFEKVEHARKRGAKILAHLRGYGASCDAHHITAPEPSGLMAARAIAEALTRAGIVGSQIDYINAHGTGTKDNDAMEAAAIERVFGANSDFVKEAARIAAAGGCVLMNAPRPVPAVSSTKRATGHTFGAAGAIEAIFCVQALREGIVPGNLGSVEGDAGLWQGADPVVREARTAEIGFALSTNFAFGGNNTALVFGKEAGRA